jgi:hypothetical protein
LFGVFLGVFGVFLESDESTQTLLPPLMLLPLLARTRKTAHQACAQPKDSNTLLGDCSATARAARIHDYEPIKATIGPLLSPHTQQQQQRSGKPHFSADDEKPCGTHTPVKQPKSLLVSHHPEDKNSPTSFGGEGRLTEKHSKSPSQ